ncbi:MAG: TetR/AcrR family transcriptional regulator [Planctomycetaceae bacterium]|nr:TetR/AcrR family transcriptional regulator [Planctomycetaceae bacterium]
MSEARTKSSARDRIIVTGEKLFYAEGVRAVGIDRIIAEAGVAKMTLYNHFASKDDLILAVLQFRDEKINKFFETEIERNVAQGLDRLQAFFAALKQWFESLGFRGCAFINATVELADPNHPAAIFSAQHKVAFHKMIREIVIEVAGPKAASVAPAISMLVEGAIVTAVIDGNPDAADVARQAAFAMVSKQK